MRISDWSSGVCSSDLYFHIRTPSMHLKDLKTKSPAQLVEMAEELGVEGASTLRKQDLMFSILKELAEEGEEIIGSGTIEVLPDSFGFLRNPERSEEHTSELQSLMRISYAVFCLTKKKKS